MLFDDKNKSVVNIKSTVAKQLKRLTTHIEDEEAYHTIEKRLENHNVDFLNPTIANKLIGKGHKNSTEKIKYNYNIIRWIFIVINLPVIFVWRNIIKPKVPELEFMSTYRFAFSILTYPIFYTLLALTFIYLYNIKTACLIVLTHAVINIVFVKIGFTSSAQRK